MFKIGEFAKLNKISIKTLRYYDELELLKPMKVDFQTGYRYYSAKQLPRLNRILALKDLGFSLNQIADIIDSQASRDIILSMLDEKKKEINNIIKSEQRRLVRIDSLINRIKEEDSFMLKYDVVLKQLEARKLAAIRDIIPDYSKQGYLWEELMRHLGMHKVKLVGPCMAIYYDQGYKESDVDIEVASCIANDVPETDRIKIKQIPAVENAACTVHKGCYEDICMAYNVLINWIEENGYKIVGQNRELYLEGEWSTQNPDEYITEIQIPVEKI
ncbi:HTH-type transcriptional activator mta [Clostridium acetireducens DSM 10703]|jgi:effector-binding domain-containing protein|uniref:HTH-type transcriptional activator mta n=1 Tax=Clostridium acetireducens DSM 10703 TaxID=1121290 RepID=A0A1E8F0V8_9CLOT|nr:MerR family transcriptional regulator [Clostridium acetireducens]OFI07105.1 HTH-type transcriptional activator mta [Clostridium acetireducens DSM 10703]